MPLLEVRDLRTSFFLEGGEARAVDGVSFALDAGRVLGLVGESGCGKSVTALSLMRLVPPPGRIVGGEVRLDGRDLLGLPERAMRAVRGAGLAMIFQEPMTSLNPVFTVGSQIAEAVRLHRPVSRREAWERAVGLLAEVGIPEPARRARDYPHRLSGGMRQRVMIAMAISCEPRVLIADEPTTVPRASACDAAHRGTRGPQALPDRGRALRRAARLGAGRERRVARHPAGRDPRPGRRVGLGEVDARASHAAPHRAHLGGGDVRRALAPGTRGARAARAPPRDADHLPGPLRLARSAHARREHRRRRARDPWPRSTRATPGAGERAARAGGPAARGRAP